MLLFYNPRMQDFCLVSLLKPVGCEGPIEGGGEERSDEKLIAGEASSEPRLLCLFGPAELPLFIRITARGLTCLPGLKSELVCPPSLLLLFSQPRLGRMSFK